MHNSIAKHIIKKSAYLLAASLILACYCTLVSAITVKIRGTPGYMEAGSTMLMAGFNFPELIYRIGKNFSNECLNISLAKSETIKEGDASYIRLSEKPCFSIFQLYDINSTWRSIMI